MGKPKKKESHDVMQALRPQCLNPDLEPLAHDLYELALNGSKTMWNELRDETFKGNSELQEKFIFASHKGMNEAQKKIVEIISSDTLLSKSHEVLFHGIADAMAWQLIGHQLCHARRFYKEQPPINLKESNFESVVFCAEDMARKNPGSMSIISDLTTFVQVGDLLTMNSRGDLTIVEVKEGKKNHEIMEFMNFFAESPCPHAFEHFAKEHGKSGIKQLQRMSRQVERMEHVTEVMSTGKSRDPDTEQHISIPDEFFYLDKWDEELNEILENSDVKGWALNVIDDCLFIGAYSKKAFNGFGHFVFNTWFDEFEGGIGSPRFRLVDSMGGPLALPVFNLSISEQHKFDLLFGRKNVCLGLNITAFLAKLKAVGIKVREATNKEVSQIEQRGVHPYKWNGKAIYLGDGKEEMLLMDGIFMRIFFHGQRPIETVQAILRNVSNIEK